VIRSKPEAENWSDAVHNDRSANLPSALLVGLVGLSKADDQDIILVRYAVDYFAVETF
jgi:hypothetical protein